MTPLLSSRAARASLLGTMLFAAPAFAHGMSAADKQAMLEGGLLSYLRLGATHMLTGYDHLLFLLGVVFFLTSARDIVKFVSVFTLGHSITLIVATFTGITANYFLIDAVIALSVCYKGFDNNGRFTSYLGLTAPNVLYMVFGFGLIHGFGLSTRLQELPLGEKGFGMLARIVSFNVGVELGQVAALLLMVLVLSAWRRRASFQLFSRVANDGLVAAGLLFFLMQLHGYVHSASPEEFGFNGDAHAHAHEEMQPAAPEEVHDNL